MMSLWTLLSREMVSKSGLNQLKIQLRSTLMLHYLGNLAGAHVACRDGLIQPNMAEAIELKEVLSYSQVGRWSLK
ncbi:hypothetical protein CsatA_008324 [Cannabis sativa]